LYAGSKSTFECNSWLQQSKENPEARVTLTASEVQSQKSASESADTATASQSHPSALQTTANRKQSSSDAPAGTVDLTPGAIEASRHPRVHVEEMDARGTGQVPGAGSMLDVHQRPAPAGLSSAASPAQQALADVRFKVTVATSNLPGAGTDASVHLTVSIDR
jgi:hypothetical protein